MSITIGDKPEMNVVNVGDELTQDQINAINAGNNPLATNPFLTKTAGDAVYAGLTANNTFTGTQAYNINSSGAAFRISQAGSGEAFRVEDQTTPDLTPFVITADGRVGIGTTTLATGASLTATGTISTLGIAVSGATASTINVNSGSAVPLTITNAGTGNSLVVNDGSGDTTPFVINNDGSVGIKRSSPSYDLDVNGTVNLSTLRFADGTTMTTKPTSPLPTSGLEAMPLVWNSSTSNWVATFNGFTLGYEGVNNGIIQSGSEYNSAIGFYQPYIQFYNGGNATTLKISPEGIRFPDNTLLTTASGGGGGGGDFLSTDGMSVVSKSYAGTIFHGTNGGDPADPYYGYPRIGFQYAALYGENNATGNYFSFDTTYLYWYNSAAGYPTYFAPSGITAGSNSFYLPSDIYAQGLNFNIWNTAKSVYSTTYTYESGVMNISWGESSLTNYGYITIGQDGLTGEPGIRFQKYGTDVGGPNTWDSNVADFTPIVDNDVVMATHRIRVRINGVDYYLIAEGPTT